MTRTAAEFASSCLAGLPGAVLSDQGTREILEEFYSTLGDVIVRIEDPVEVAAALILDPEQCPEVALDGLLTMGGFSAGIPWVRGLDAATKRKLAAVAPVLWGTKGQPGCVRSLYRMLSGGQSVVIADWLYWRYAVGTRPPMVGWVSPQSAGAHRALLFLSDPLDEVDRDLVANALKTIKPGIDTWTLAWCHYAEPWDTDLMRWVPTGTPAVSDGVVVLEAGDAMSCTAGDGWDVGRVVSKFALDDSATQCEVRVASDDAEWLLAISEAGVSVRYIVGGVETVVASGTPVLAAGVEYLLDWRVLPIVGGFETKVVLDGNVIAVGTM